MKKICAILLMLFGICVFGQENSIGASIDETMINQLLTVIDTMQGKSYMKIMGSKTKYNWEIKNMAIDIEPEGINFCGDIKVNIFGQDLKSPVSGVVDFILDKEKDIITFKVKKLVPGDKSLENTVDISKLYSPEFNYNIPKIEGQEYEIDMPDGSKKSILMTIKDKTIVLEKDKICVYSQVEFANKN